LKHAKHILCIALSITMMTGLLLSCASAEFQEDPARKRAHELTEEAHDVHWPQDLEKVIKLTTKAIESDPEYPWPYSMRGAAYNAMGKPKRALEDLHMALILSPDFASALINRGISYIELGQYDMAKSDLEAALELASHNITALMKMAEVLTVEGDIAGACAYLRKAVAMGFNNPGLLDREPNLRALRISECYDDLDREYFQRMQRPDM